MKVMDTLYRGVSPDNTRSQSMVYSAAPMVSETGLQYSLSDHSPLYQQNPEQQVISPPSNCRDSGAPSSLSSSSNDALSTFQISVSSPTSVALRTNPPCPPRWNELNAGAPFPAQVYPNAAPPNLSVSQTTGLSSLQRHAQVKNGDPCSGFRPSAHPSESGSVDSLPSSGWQNSVRIANDVRSQFGQVDQFSEVQVAKSQQPALSTALPCSEHLPTPHPGHIQQPTSTNPYFSATAVPPTHTSAYPVQSMATYPSPAQSSSYGLSPSVNSVTELTPHRSRTAEQCGQSHHLQHPPTEAPGPNMQPPLPPVGCPRAVPTPPLVTSGFPLPNKLTHPPTGFSSAPTATFPLTGPKVPPIPNSGRLAFNGPVQPIVPVSSEPPPTMNPQSQQMFPRNPLSVPQYPPRVTNDVRTPPVTPSLAPATAGQVPVASYTEQIGIRSSLPPTTHPYLPPKPNTFQPNYPRQGGPANHSAFFRSPGTAATAAEWSHVKSPIGLLQENNLLPSDTAEVPPKPAISTSVNCDPDIMRCTLTNFPSTSKLLSRCRLPLGLVMHPFRDLSSLHTITSTVIVRCRSCRTYINPFVQFVDSGRRWRCPVCFLSNTVPDDFFYDPGTQSYGDPSRRPEIRSATVEFIAPPEYMLRPPQPATYLFCFDVSRSAIATGYLRFTCERLVNALNKIPGDCRRQIGFITFDSAIHFYKLCGDSMKLLICPDLEEPFLPDYEGLMNRLDDSSEAIKDFLLRLPDTFEGTSDVGNCLGATLQIALKMIGGTGGRVTVFNTCLPNMGAGSLQVREDQNDRISADVKNLGPAIDFYKTFALDCAAQQVAVDLFIMNSQYCDIATLSGAARFSSGCVYHYPDFYCPPNACQSSAPVSTNEDESAQQTGAQHPVLDRHGQPNTVPIELERFRRDFDRYLSRKIGFEAVMRIRCTHGLSIQTFHGSFFVRSVDLMSLPNVNPDAGFAVQLNISESLENYSTVCCQTAILYTSSQGDRRIRVHTLCLPVVHNASEVFQGADQGAIACLIGKMAVDRAINSGISNAREAVATSVADALSAYASAIGITASTSISSYAIACPPNLRLLVLYICGLLRYLALRVGVPVRIDDRSAALERLKTAAPDDMLTLIYPRLYAVHQFVSKPIGSTTLTLAQKAAALRLSDYGDARVDADQHSEDGDSSASSVSTDIGFDAEQLPGQLHLSARYVSRSGVFLLDTGEMLYLLVGSGDESSVDGISSSEMLQQLLGISKPTELPACGGPFNLPPLPSHTGKTSNPPRNDDMPIARRRLLTLISLIRRQRPTNNALVCMRHDAPADLRTRFLSALIEDRTEFAPSYHEFLQMVQNLMRG
ncbi:Protein transport protein Sec24B [Clonorchis sinensis]|uniref:Protein transport protein Sec24B n=1 Tax=Clonorchis sinensis TaxID=79923 RepID=A0A3R7EY08_CLOSI|nr:Protein transport protein Sec24B [Clonorchis sinensis]